MLLFSALRVEIALSFFSIRFAVLQILCTRVFKALVHVFRSMTECLSVHLHVVSPLFTQFALIEMHEMGGVHGYSEARLKVVFVFRLRHQKMCPKL